MRTEIKTKRGTIKVGPGCNLSGLDLSGVNFSSLKMNLSKINFRDATLYKARFAYTNLIHADFEGANLEDANFYEADLRNTEFKDAVLYNANFENASLVYANLGGATLDNACFENANLRHASLPEPGGSISNADGIIDAGYDSRYYRFLGVRTRYGLYIVAGCRYFFNIEKANAHWANRHMSDPELHNECLDKVKFIKDKAIKRGWI